MTTLEGSEKEYTVFTKAEESKLEKEVRAALANCKMSLEETIKLDDDMNSGFVSLEGLKESFEVMELEINPLLEEFIFYFIFKNSSSCEKMRYPALIDLLDQIDDSIDEPEMDEPEADPEPEEPTQAKAPSRKDTSDGYDDDFDNDASKLKPEKTEDEVKEDYGDDFDEPASIKESMEQVVESHNEPPVESMDEPVVESMNEPVKESMDESINESVKDPVQESMNDPLIESEKEPVVNESVHESVHESVKESAHESKNLDEDDYENEFSKEEGVNNNGDHEPVHPSVQAANAAKNQDEAEVDAEAEAEEAELINALRNKDIETLDEEEGLTIAEHIFGWIAEALISKNTNVSTHFNEYI